MFKKSLFLGLAFTLSTTIASADCLSTYEEFLDKNQKNVTMLGVVSSTAMGGTVSASKGSNPGYEGTALVVAAGGAVSMSMAKILQDILHISDVVNLIKDAKLGKGFHLNKLSADEQLMGYTSNRSPKAIAQAINNLNNNNSICENGDVVEKEKFYHLLIAELNSKK